MNQQAIADYLSHLGNIKKVIGHETNNNPQIAWEDTFYYIVDVTGESPKMPFATIITQDYPDFDEASNLNRKGLFRLNIDLSQEQFKSLFGYLPIEHQAHNDFDYTALDQIFPHPVYANYGWISIINPSETSESQVKDLLRLAHTRALQKVSKSSD